MPGLIAQVLGKIAENSLSDSNYIPSYYIGLTNLLKYYKLSINIFWGAPSPDVLHPLMSLSVVMSCTSLRQVPLVGLSMQVIPSPLLPEAHCQWIYRALYDLECA